MISLRTLGACGFGFTIGAAVTLGAVAHANPQSESSTALVGQLGRVLVHVENGYVDPVERSKLLEGAIKGMVSELDPHSMYLAPEEMKQLLDETSGQFAGVGIEVDIRNESIVVIAPLEGSPAEKAGIRSGDKIVAVDRDRVEASGLSKTLKKMRGKVGTHVVLTVVREGAKEALLFDLVRATVKMRSVEWAKLERGIGYIRVKQFQERTHDEFLTAVRDLKSGGALNGIVLDLRFNPGGLVDAASTISDELLDSGVIYSTKRRGQVETQVSASSGGAVATEKLAVLVNEWSASASELLAGALQDQKRGRVFGANTFGKGSVQTILDLPAGAGLKLTSARYYTPSGRSIQAEGIHPDVLVAAPTGIPVLKERDLEGHLGSTPDNPPKVDVRTEEPIAVTPDGGAPRLMRAREMPADPRKGTDAALTKAFEWLLQP